MAYKTNAQVAAAIFRNPTTDVFAANFSLHSYGAHTINRVPRDGLARTVDVYSYGTCIASVIHNAHTGKRELWTTTCRYSSTTDKHMRLVWRAYHDAVNAGEDIEHFAFDVAETASRTRLGQLSPLGGPYYQQFVTNLQRIVARGVHNTTRRAAYERALAAVRTGLDVTTRDVPVHVVLASNPAGYEVHLQWALDVERMLSAWDDLSVADLRAVVSGYLELEAEKS